MHRGAFYGYANAHAFLFPPPNMQLLSQAVHRNTHVIEDCCIAPLRAREPPPQPSPELIKAEQCASMHSMFCAQKQTLGFPWLEHALVWFHSAGYAQFPVFMQHRKNGMLPVAGVPITKHNSTRQTSSTVLTPTRAGF